MPLVVALWPDNTISIVKMKTGYSMLNLFYELDQEADPVDAKCYEVRARGDGSPLHVAFRWNEIEVDDNDAPESMTIPFDNLVVDGEWGGSSRIRHRPWPEDIFDQYIRSLRPRGKARASHDPQ